MKTVALIPIRAGSKGIPNKNMKEMCGKPLCYWVIDEALKCEEIDEVWVSTESNEYIEKLKTERSEVHVHKRPDLLATDEVSTEDVMLDFAYYHEFDIIVLLQATSPLTTKSDIGNSISKVNFLRSSISVVEMKRFVWNYSENGDNAFSPINYSISERPHRNGVFPIYIENGAIYCTCRSALLSQKNRVDNVYIEPIVMPYDTIHEVDEPEDWDKVEKLLRNRCE